MLKRNDLTYRELKNKFPFEETDKLGNGGYGDVYKVQKIIENKEFAIKISKKGEGLLNETELINKLPKEHRNIADYESYGRITDTEQEYIVLQYYKDGNLSNLMTILSPRQKHFILEELLNGIKILHESGIIHKDLKPTNILLAKEGELYVPKIADFGISKSLDENDKNKTQKTSKGGGTRIYASPELSLDGDYRENTDLWSFGVIAFKLYTEKLPFKNLSEFITNPELPESIKSIPEPWQTIIRKCIIVDRKIRIESCEKCLEIIDEEITIKKVKVPEPIPVPPNPEDGTNFIAKYWWVLAIITVAVIMAFNIGKYINSRPPKSSFEQKQTEQEIKGLKNKIEELEKELGHDEIQKQERELERLEQIDTIVTTIPETSINKEQLKPNTLKENIEQEIVSVPDPSHHHRNLLPYGVTIPPPPSVPKPNKHRNGDIYNPDGIIELVYVESDYYEAFNIDRDNREPLIDYPKIKAVLKRSFYISKFEVTQAQWKAIMGEENNPSHFKGDDLPVEMVSYNDVEEFLSRLRTKTGRLYILPSIKEWVFAARGGHTDGNCIDDCKYSGSNNIDNVAWYKGNSDKKTHPAGLKNSNELGIYDMSGNVWELTMPLFPNKSKEKQVMIFGGGWNSAATGIQDNSNVISIDTRRNDIGFRVVLYDPPYEK